MKNHKTIGVDVGGTGIKAATVDLTTGRLTVRRRTPVAAATRGNDAGIIGAALWAAQRHGQPPAAPPAKRAPKRTAEQPTERKGVES